MYWTEYLEPSPDDSSVVFWDERQLNRVATDGGPVETLFTTDGDRG